MKREELSKLLQNQHGTPSGLGTTTITRDSKFYPSATVAPQMNFDWFKWLAVTQRGKFIHHTQSLACPDRDAGYCVIRHHHINSNFCC